MKPLMYQYTRWRNSFYCRLSTVLYHLAYIARFTTLSLSYVMLLVTDKGHSLCSPSKENIRLLVTLWKTQIGFASLRTIGLFSQFQSAETVFRVFLRAGNGEEYCCSTKSPLFWRSTQEKCRHSNIALNVDNWEWLWEDDQSQCEYGRGLNEETGEVG
jgi:hypothetical protein